MKNIIKNIIVVLIWLIIIFGTNKFIMTIVKVEGSSMLPNFKNGDYLIINKLSRLYKVNDIVVINFHSIENVLLVKRIVAGPESTIFIDNYKLNVNGQTIDESSFSPIWQSSSFYCRYSDQYQTYQKQYFVLGDNRCFATDSRNFGAINAQDILGKVIFKF